MMRCWPCLAAVLVALTYSTLHAQTSAPVPLANVQRLKCTFTQKALGTWDKDVIPTAELTPAKLSMVFDAIDTQGTLKLNLEEAINGFPDVMSKLVPALQSHAESRALLQCDAPALASAAWKCSN